MSVLDGSSARRHRLATARRIVALAALGLIFTPAIAAAQLSRVGNSQGVLIPPGLVRGTDVGYDPVNSVYLLVGADGWMGGVFTDATGAIVPGTAQFQIGSAGGSANNIYAHYPRVRYSPAVNNGQGGFLVTWVQNDGSPNHVHAVIVAYPTGVVSPDRQISDDQHSGAWWEAGPPVAYSATSQRFLVAWQTAADGYIQGRFVDLAGAPTGDILNFETGCSRDPGLAWNEATNEFGLSSSAFCSGAYVQLRRISASTGQQTPGPKWGYASGTFVTDINVNSLTRHYLVAWADSAGGKSAELDENGALLRSGVLGVGTYDGMDIAFNAASGTVLAVGMGNSFEILGLEADGTGVPMMAQTTLTNGGGTRGSFYPRTAPRSGTKQWNISYSRQFVTGTNQIIATGSSLGGPVAPVSNIQVGVDSPANPSFYRLTDSMYLAGWAVDKGASSGTGIDAVHVWAFPASGASPIFLAGITSFSSRPDVAAAFGNPQFDASGFNATIGALPAGTYTISVYPHSSVTGSFGPPRSLTATFASAVPAMSLDGPGNGAVVSTVFPIGGWALDRFALSGTGVDAVHVWAFPASGAPAIFVGSANLGVYRPDVGQAFGSQFANSGFALAGSLPVGTYRLVAYMHDVLTNSFNLSQSASITVSGPAMAIDIPSGTNTLVTAGASIVGWAIDPAAPSGTGVDAVHVWAFPSAGGAPIFVGSAGLGLSRPDVGAIFGSQFTNSGYFQTLGGLPPGGYTLGVYAHSTVTNSFSQARFVTVVYQ